MREEASAAKAAAGRAAAEAEFERGRAARLAEGVEMQRQQLESMIASSAKYQALLTDSERKLAQAEAAADEARDAVCAGLLSCTCAAVVPACWSCCVARAACAHRVPHCTPQSAPQDAVAAHCHRPACLPTARRGARRCGPRAWTPRRSC